MTTFHKIPIPENLVQCSACGFTAPKSQFDAKHPKSCKILYWLFVLGFPVLALVCWGGVILVKILETKP